MRGRKKEVGKELISGLTTIVVVVIDVLRMSHGHAQAQMIVEFAECGWLSPGAE